MDQDKIDPMQPTEKAQEFEQEVSRLDAEIQQDGAVPADASDPGRQGDALIGSNAADKLRRP